MNALKYRFFYFLNELFFPETKIKIKYFSYTTEALNAKKDKINLSILDLIFKTGKKAKNNLKENFNLIS